MSDRELLQRFKETGSEAAFRSLVDRYAGLVFAVALRRTGNRSVAEEVVQGVFMILAAKAAKLRTRGELAPWLHRTTLLEASNAARKEGRRQRKLEELVEMTQNGSDPQWQEIALLSAERQAALQRGETLRAERAQVELLHQLRAAEEAGVQSVQIERSGTAPPEDTVFGFSLGVGK